MVLYMWFYLHKMQTSKVLLLRKVKVFARFVCSYINFITQETIIKNLVCNILSANLCKPQGQVHARHTQ